LPALRSLFPKYSIPVIKKNNIMEYIFGYIAAVIIGIIMGLLGGGGSILSVPVLVYTLGLNPITATAYSLLDQQLWLAVFKISEKA